MCGIDAGTFELDFRTTVFMSIVISNMAGSRQNFSAEAGYSEHYRLVPSAKNRRSEGSSNRHAQLIRRTGV